MSFKRSHTHWQNRTFDQWIGPTKYGFLIGKKTANTSKNFELPVCDTPQALKHMHPITTSQTRRIFLHQLRANAMRKRCSSQPRERAQKDMQMPTTRSRVLRVSVVFALANMHRTGAHYTRDSFAMLTRTRTHRHRARHKRASASTKD